MRPPTGFRSLRWRLTALIAAVLVLAVGFSFAAIYRGTGSELRRRIDRELRTDSLAFARGVPRTASSTAAVEAAARAYLSGQTVSRAANLLFLRVAGRAPVAALLAAYLIATRTSRPLTRMARIAQQVNAGDLSPRMSQSGPNDEIHVLADSFDHMLDRLEDAFARQRAFAADASHELRTPLTVIRGQLEVLARQRSPSTEEVRRVEQLVRTETLRMQRLVEDLLAL